MGTYVPVDDLIHVACRKPVNTTRNLREKRLTVMLDAYLMEEIEKDGPADERLEVPFVALVMSEVVHRLGCRHCLDVSLETACVRKSEIVTSKQTVGERVSALLWFNSQDKCARTTQLKTRRCAWR